MMGLAKDRVLRDAFSLSALWVGCFFLSLLLTSPLRFLALGWRLLVHGVLWRSFDWSEVLLNRNVYLATVLAVPHLLVGYIRTEDTDAFFLACVRRAAPSAQLLSLPQRPRAVSTWEWLAGIARQLRWGVLVWVSSFVPYVGVAVAVAVKFWVFRQSLNTMWALGLSALALLAPFDSSFVVFLFVSSHALGKLLLQPHVWDRFSEARAVRRQNVHWVVALGLAAIAILAVPVAGGPLLWFMYALGARLYVTTLMPQLEKQV